MLFIVFEDYSKTGCLYHVINIMDLKNVFDKGIKYNDKNTYFNRYIKFHSYIDSYRNSSIPEWVERKKAIFTSMNYKGGHQWHSHSAILKVYADEDKCWVCNENLANIIYEPLILQDMDIFSEAKIYMDRKAPNLAKQYWQSSLSFKDNKTRRKDKDRGYDAEVLVFENIRPEKIECLYIVSDHKFMKISDWKDYFIEKYKLD